MARVRNNRETPATEKGLDDLLAAFVETASNSVGVLERRVALLHEAFRQPHTADYVELERMVTEKGDAFLLSWAAGAQALVAAQGEAAASGARWMEALSGNAATDPLAADMRQAMAFWVHSGIAMLEPYREGVRRNAKRLKIDLHAPSGSTSTL